MVGIYKIESPEGKIYVGQSKNIEQRQFKRRVNGDNLLLNSFSKYGKNNHTFTVIEECKEEELNNKERFWQEYYDVLGENGLNSLLEKTKEKPRVFREEVKLKMSQSSLGVVSWNKGIAMTDEAKKKLSISKKGCVPWNKGKKTMQDVHNKKLILDINNGVFYSSIREAADIFKVNRNTLAKRIKKNHKTSLRYV